MAHNLDTTNDRASFVSAREDAWHRLGTVLDHSFTAEEAMKEGLLGGWDVRAIPLEVADPATGVVVPVSDRRAILRTNPVNRQPEYLASVGNAYHIIQNEEHAELLNALVDESGAHFETAGAINGGRQVFITMKLPGHLMVGGVDQVDTYLAAVNSHDGSTPFTIMTTPVRIVCENTLNIALGARTGMYRVRHTSGAQKMILGQAREALDISFKYLDDFQEQAERLINTEMTQMEFEKIVTKEFGVPDDAPKAAVTRAEDRLDQFAELFGNAATHEAVRNTAWAGFNALTEWYDHQAPTRGAADADARRAVRTLMEPEFKTKALKLMLQHA